MLHTCKKNPKSTRTGHHKQECGVPHGKYLLLDLLEGGLLDDTLHGLLLDGLCDLLLSQWEILREVQKSYCHWSKTHARVE